MLSVSCLMQSGFLFVDKPTDWTSHDVVGYLRGVTKIKKIGHAGTLDPFATGLLIVGVGRESTKRLDEFKGMDKEYIATVRLGGTSDTYDRTGVIQDTDNMIQPTEIEVREIVKAFLGEQEQIPPMYSAKKVGGKKLYELARKGVEVERQPSIITIHSLEVLEYTYPSLRLAISCSTGTYIRTFCHDIGQKLGTGAYCQELRRTKIGPYTVEGAKGPKDFSRETWEQNLQNI